MKTAVFSAHAFERPSLVQAAEGKHELVMLDVRLSVETAVLASGCIGVSLFVSDDAKRPALTALSALGVKFIALRSAGFNHVDIPAAKELGIRVARVPAYSPYAIAEHAVAMMLAMNRNLIRAHNRVMDQNFSLDGLVGFDMHGKTAGVIGTGKIGRVAAQILTGFGCRVLAYDVAEDPELKAKHGVRYCSLDELCKSSDIITLHTPLTKQTKHLINADRLAMMKDKVMLINTSRGAIVNASDMIDALKQGRVGYFGMDVYEEEEGLFFEDHSGDIITDDHIARLMTFPNVLITSHQAFLTDTALRNIAETTMENLTCFEKGIACQAEVV